MIYVLCALQLVEIYLLIKILRVRRKDLEELL